MSSEIVEAEKLVIQCGEDHNDCLRCRPDIQAACAKAYDRFVDRYDAERDVVPVKHYIRFTRRLAYLQKLTGGIGIVIFTSGFICLTVGYWSYMLDGIL